VRKLTKISKTVLLILIEIDPLMSFGIKFFNVFSANMVGTEEASLDS